MVTPSRSMVSTGTRCCGSIFCGTRNSVPPRWCCLPLRGQRCPGGIAHRQVQRVGIALPGRDWRRNRSRSASRRSVPPSSARSAAPSKPDGSGYFFTAWRCTNSRLQAWIGSSARVWSAERLGLRLDPEQRRHEPIQDAGPARRPGRIRRVSRHRPARHVRPAGVGEGPASCASSACRKRWSRPDQPFAAGEIGEGEAKSKPGRLDEGHGSKPLFLLGSG